LDHTSGQLPASTAPVAVLQERLQQVPQLHALLQLVRNSLNVAPVWQAALQNVAEALPAAAAPAMTEDELPLLDDEWAQLYSDALNKHESLAVIIRQRSVVTLTKCVLITLLRLCDVYGLSQKCGAVIIGPGDWSQSGHSGRGSSFEQRYHSSTVVAKAKLAVPALRANVIILQTRL